MEISEYYEAIGRLVTARSAAEMATEDALIVIMGEHTRFLFAGADVGLNISRLRKMTTVSYRSPDPVISATVPYCIRRSVLAGLDETLRSLDREIARVGRIVHGTPAMDVTDGPARGAYSVRPAGGRDQSAIKHLRNPSSRDRVPLADVVSLAKGIEVLAAEVIAVATKIRFRDADVIRKAPAATSSDDL